MLDEEEEEPLAACDVEGQFHLAPQEIVDPPTFESWVRTLPAWASHMKNMRGLIEFSRSHFYGIVGVQIPSGQGVIGEAVIDTGGFRSLIDRDTVAQFGLKVQVGD